MIDIDTRWEHMSATMRRGPATTNFAIVVRHKGRVTSQTVTISNWRLDRYPTAYKRTLDWMVRDIDMRLA